MEAPLEMPLRKVKDNVIAWFFVENQGNEDQVSKLQDLPKVDLRY